MRLIALLLAILGPTVAAHAAPINFGDILVVNQHGLGGECPLGCGGVIRIDPVTGAQTAVRDLSQRFKAGGPAAFDAFSQLVSRLLSLTYRRPLPGLGVLPGGRRDPRA